MQVLKVDYVRSGQWETKYGSTIAIPGTNEKGYMDVYALRPFFLSQSSELISHGP